MDERWNRQLITYGSRRVHHRRLPQPTWRQLHDQRSTDLSSRPTALDDALAESCRGKTARMLPREPSHRTFPLSSSMILPTAIPSTIVAFEGALRDSEKLSVLSLIPSPTI